MTDDRRQVCLVIHECAAELHPSRPSVQSSHGMQFVCTLLYMHAYMLFIWLCLDRPISRQYARPVTGQRTDLSPVLRPCLYVNADPHPTLLYVPGLSRTYMEYIHTSGPLGHLSYVR